MAERREPAVLDQPIIYPQTGKMTEYCQTLLDPQPRFELLDPLATLTDVIDKVNEIAIYLNGD